MSLALLFVHLARRCLRDPLYDEVSRWSKHASNCIHLWSGVRFSLSISPGSLFVSLASSVEQAMSIWLLSQLQRDPHAGITLHCPLTCLPASIFEEPFQRVLRTEESFDMRAHPFIMPNAKQKLVSPIFLSLKLIFDEAFFNLPGFEN